LNDEYHVLAPDLRGHGDSEWDRSAHPEYNYDRYAADLHELCENSTCAISSSSAIDGRVGVDVYAATYPGRAGRSSWSIPRSTCLPSGSPI